MLSLKAVLLGIALGLTAVSGWSFLMLPWFPLLFISLPLYRLLNDLCLKLWYTIIPVVMELLCGMKVLISGDHEILTSPCVIIMNHRTRFDWLFLWCFLMRRGCLSYEKIILKEPIKRVPLYGWGTQCAGFLFLSRSWTNDEQLITRSLNYYIKSSYPLQLLLFPEGTDLSPSNKAKSQQFAKERQLQVYNNVLHPRTKGFIKCIKELTKSDFLKSVVDITVAYNGDMPQNESDLAAGRWPSEVHFNVKTFPVSELPIHDKPQLEQWIQDRWQTKEELLSDFYHNQKFADKYTYLSGDHCTVHLIGVLVFWCVMNMLLFYLLATSWLFWLLLATGTVMFLIMSRHYGGIEQLELLRFYR